MKSLSTVMYAALTMISFSLAGTQLYAQTENAAEEDDFVQANHSMQYADSSQALRQGKQAAVLLGIGLRTEDLSEGSLSYMHFLNPDLQIIATYSSLDSSIKEDAGESDDGDRLVYVGIETEVEGSAYSLSLRRFYGNSFYIEGGLDFVEAKGRFVVDESLFFNRVKADLGSYSRLSAMIQIGNQWQWQNFTLGTSWVGLLLPLTKSQDFKNNADEYKDTFNSIEAFIDNSESVQLSALRFHLGWAF